MVSAIGIVPVTLYLLRWNANVLSVFSAFCVDVAVDVLDFSRVAVRVIATADGRLIGHTPCRIEFIVQELILWRVLAKPGVALSVLRLDPRQQRTAKTAAEKEFA
jgi:hypothetical protein